MSVLLGTESSAMPDPAPKHFGVERPVSLKPAFAPPAFESPMPLDNDFEKPIRLWEPFDDEHIRRLYIDPVYRHRTVAESALGGFSEVLPDYEGISKGIVNRLFFSQLTGRTDDEIERFYPEHRVGLSLAFTGREASDDEQLFDDIREQIGQRDAYDERMRTLAKAMSDGPSFSEIIDVGKSLAVDALQLDRDVKNQILRYGYVEPIGGSIEGLSRAASFFTKDAATANERRSTEELEREYQRLEQMIHEGQEAGLDPETLQALAIDAGDKERVLKNRREGRPNEAGRDLMRSALDRTSDLLTSTADITDNVRQSVGGLFPVSKEFSESLPGEILAGIAQMPVNLAAYAIPGLGPLMSFAQLYDQGYGEAMAEEGTSPRQAHRAGLGALPAGLIDVLMDKLLIARTLKRYDGRLSVREFRNTLFLLGGAGGTAEAAQQFWMNFNAAFLSGYDPERRLDQDVIRSFVVGLAVNSLTAGVGQGLRSKAFEREERQSKDDNYSLAMEDLLKDTEFSRSASVRYDGHVDVESILGRPVSNDQLSGLAGAPADAEVLVSFEKAENKISLSVKTSRVVLQIRKIWKDRSGKLKIENTYFQKTPDTPSGYGGRSLMREVIAARSLGIAEIEVFAAGFLGSEDGLNGYYTWPRYGFDAILSIPDIESLPSELRDARTVLDLMESGPGRSSWRTFGTGRKMYFSLKNNSKSIEVLTSYFGKEDKK